MKPRQCHNTRHNQTFDVNIEASLNGIEIICRLDQNIRFTAIRSNFLSQTTTIKAYDKRDGKLLYMEIRDEKVDIRDFIEALYAFQLAYKQQQSA